MKRRLLFLFLTGWLTAQAGQEVEITAEHHHQLVLANDQIRVFNVDVAPQSETLMHWHRHDYVYVMLGPAKVVNAVQGKDPLTVTLSDGDVGYVAATFAHIVRNPTSAPFRNVTIELLQDAKLHQSPAHWVSGHPEEDRGLSILNGGTREILLVRNGLRVCEFELQPGGVIPMREPSGPQLFVALTDYELQTTARAKGSKSIFMQRGESQWIAGGFPRVLTNASQNMAKFIALEFR
jgi:quercetin dioxygenase-like cupin family protein